MNCIDLLIDFITRCMNFIERYSNALVGIGTIITSIITIRVYKKQNRIYKEQTALQRNQNQPYFVVYTRVSKDKENEDTIHGNETLYVENVGQKFLDINIEDRVFFTLKNKLTQILRFSFLYTTTFLELVLIGGKTLVKYIFHMEKEQTESLENCIVQQ